MNPVYRKIYGKPYVHPQSSNKKRYEKKELKVRFSDQLQINIF